MSVYGNHYKRQVEHLESLVSGKLRELSLLQKENQLLQHKEQALRSAIEGIAGPLTLVKQALEEDPEAAQDALPAPAQACSTDWGTHDSSTLNHNTRQDPSNKAQSSSGSGICAGVETSGHSATSRPPAAAPYKDGRVLLERLDTCEARVQAVLHQLGCCLGERSYKQLYTTQLLRRAVTHPEVMKGYLAMPKSERLQYWCRAHNQMALLLSKYDSNMVLSTGNAREQLDTIVDDLLERVTVCALLDPPSKHMQCFMFNVETHEFERYPDGWWHQVIQGMAMSAEQKVAMKLVWDKVKPETQQLTEQYERLQVQLQQLHIQQLQLNRSFEQGIMQPMQPTLQLAMLEHQTHKLQQQLQRQQQQQQQQQQAGQACEFEQSDAPQQLYAAWQQGSGIPLMHPGAAATSVNAGLEQELMVAISAELGHRQCPQQQQLPGAQAAQGGAFGAAAAGAGAAGGGGGVCVIGPYGSIGASGLGAGTPAGSAQASPNIGLHVDLQQPGEPLGCADIMHSATGTPVLQQPQLQLQQLTLQSPVTPEGAAPAPAAGIGGAGSQGCPPPPVQDITAECDIVGVSVTPGTYTSKLGEAEEVLLQAGSAERQLLERRMQAVNDRIKVLNFCLTLQLHNTLSKKQLAAMCVHAHPFVYDSLSICETLDEQGWE